MKSILFILFFAVSYSSFGPLDVVETKKDSVIGEFRYLKSQLVELTLNEFGYRFMYRNLEYQHISEYATFYIDNETSLNQLYDLCVKKIEDKDKESTRIDLGNGESLIISYMKPAVRFYHYDKYGTLSTTQYMRIKNLKALFGKE